MKQNNCNYFSAELHFIHLLGIRLTFSVSMFFAPRHIPTLPQRSSGLSVWCCCTALFLGVGAWASQAVATCGDYLTSGSGHFAMPDARGTEQVPLRPEGENALPRRPTRLPCHGPGCSSHESPVRTAPVVVRMQHDLTGICLEQDVGVLQSPPHWATQSQESLTAQNISFRILRPPRSLPLAWSARDVVA
jgi:hypothetical protein